MSSRIGFARTRGENAKVKGGEVKSPVIPKEGAHSYADTDIGDGAL